jgi:hypothetical protein
VFGITTISFVGVAVAVAVKVGVGHSGPSKVTNSSSHGSRSGDAS